MSAKKKSKIYLAFVDDWELRGDGSGDIEKIQFQPMRKLVSIYEKYGIQGSFNAEVMQQITFRKFQDDYPELKKFADTWDDLVRDTFRRGYDIQLHIHPQWSIASFARGTWKLEGDWSILNYNPGKAREMIHEGKNYLENLLRPLCPDYRCISFRAGAWCIAPSPHILSLLANAGIELDISIVGNTRFNTKNLQIDYTHCEESFLPFYPCMDDARKVSPNKESIICVPTNHFYEPRHKYFMRQFKRVWGRVAKRFDNEASRKLSRHKNENRMNKSQYNEWEEVTSRPLLNTIKNIARPYLRGACHISDIAAMDYSMLCSMMKYIRKRAEKLGLPEAPIILENHTKDIRTFSSIEKFLADISKADDVECLTLTQLAGKLKDGTFPVKTAKRRSHISMARDAKN